MHKSVKPRNSFKCAFIPCCFGEAPINSNISDDSSTSSSCNTDKHPLRHESIKVLPPDTPDHHMIDHLQVNQAIGLHLFGRGGGSNKNKETFKNVTSAKHSHEMDILSTHNRGTTVVSWNSKLDRRCVVRVSPCELTEKPDDILSASASDLSGVHQCSHRLLAFGQFMRDHGQTIPGIVPFLCQPQSFGVNFVVEMYEEIVCDSLGGARIDLYTYMVNYVGDSPVLLKKALMYLHDVLEGVTEMHRHGWAHLDLSLENIVLSDDRAYLIDFESVLPFETEENGALRRNQIGVPVKLPFVPPEHMVSTANDFLSLPSYDVWAFGVMMFTILFGEYLFQVQKMHEKKRLVIPEHQIRYFMKHGFKRFMARFHPAKYEQLVEKATQQRGRFYCESTLYTLGGDLLSKIFRRPKRVPIDESGCSSTSESDDDDDNSSSPPVYFDDSDRFDMSDVLNHPFWTVNRLRR